MLTPLHATRRGLFAAVATNTVAISTASASPDRPVSQDGGANLIANIAALRSVAGTFASGAIYLAGHSTPGDGAAGYFLAGPAAADNGGTIINSSDGRSWYRQFSGPVSLAWFGALGDWNDKNQTGTDNSLAIANWQHFLISTRTIGSIPEGYFGFSQPQAPKGIFPGMIGQGAGYSRLYFAGAQGTTAFTFEIAGNISGRLESFSLSSAGHKNHARDIQRNGIYLKGPGCCNPLEIAIYNFNGFGLAILRIYDSLMQDVTVQNCGNNSLYTWPDSHISLTAPRVLKSDTANFSPSIVGQKIDILGAGENRATLSTSVKRFQDSKTIILNEAASTAVAGTQGLAEFAYGHAFSVNTGLTPDTSNHTHFNRLQVELSVDQAMYVHPRNLNLLFSNLHTERTSRESSAAGAITHNLQGNSCTYVNARLETKPGQAAYLLGGFGSSYTDFRIQDGNPVTLTYAIKGNCTITDLCCTGPVSVPKSNRIHLTLINPNLINPTLIDRTGGLFLHADDPQSPAVDILGGTVTRLNICDPGASFHAHHTMIQLLQSQGGTPVRSSALGGKIGLILGSLNLSITDAEIERDFSTASGSIIRSSNAVFLGMPTIGGDNVLFEAERSDFTAGLTLGEGRPIWIFGLGNRYGGAVSAGFFMPPQDDAVAAESLQGRISYHPRPPAGGVLAWGFIGSQWVAVANAGAFTSGVTGTGSWRQAPDGFITQQGTVFVPAGATLQVTLPKAFANAANPPIVSLGLGGDAAGNAPAALMSANSAASPLTEIAIRNPNSQAVTAIWRAEGI